MIHIAICDDEKCMSDHIRSFVSDFFRKKNREISLHMFSGGEELLSYNGQIDILFLGYPDEGHGRHGNRKETEGGSVPGLSGLHYGT